MGNAPASRAYFKKQKGIFYIFSTFMSLKSGGCYHPTEGEGISCNGNMHPPSHGMWDPHTIRERMHISNS